MADKSIWRQAWERTEFKGIKRLFGSLGLGVVTLVYNHEAGLRTWHLTLVFLACTVAAYGTLTLLEFAGYGVALWVHEKYLALKHDLKTDLRAGLSEEITKSRKSQIATDLPRTPYVAVYPNEARVRQMIAELKNSSGQTVQIFSSIGDPESYRYAEALGAIFKQAGCTVLHEPIFMEGSRSGLFLGLEDIGSIPLEARFVSRVLTSAGIKFKVDEYNEYKHWCIVVGHSI